MKKLSSITTPQHYFYTVDGAVLKTTHDLFSYLSACDQESFDYHVSAEKNDFANWVHDTLLFPELSVRLAACRTVAECKQALIDFFKQYEYHNGRIDPKTYFFTVDEFTLKNAHELFYYINNCADASYYHHVTAERNDFYLWIKDQLRFSGLAEKFKAAKNKQEAVNVLKDFLLNGMDAMYDSEEYKSTAGAYGLAPNSSINPSTNTQGNHQAEIPNDKGVSTFMKEDAVPEPSPIIDPNVSHAVNQMSEPHQESVPNKDMAPVFDKNGFRQFTDEELERFTKFGVKDNTTATDPKVEFLKQSLNELKNMVKQLREAEKDPLVADMMLRAVGPKIDYYALSKNPADYDRIVTMMKDVQKEIAYYADQKTVNFAQEILKDLELETVAMKKL